MRRRHDQLGGLRWRGGEQLERGTAIPTALAIPHRLHARPLPLAAHEAIKRLSRQARLLRNRRMRERFTRTRFVNQLRNWVGFHKLLL